MNSMLMFGLGRTATATANNVIPTPYLWYKMNGTNGANATTLVDQGTAGYDLTVVNAPTYSSDAASGAGQSVALDGSSQYAVGSSNLSLGGNAITLAGWLKVAAFATDTNPEVAYLMAPFGENPPGTNIFIPYIGDGTLAGNNRLRACAINGSAQSVNVYHGTGLSTGQWYHVAMVYDGTNVTLYVNGAYSNAASLSGPVACAGGPFYIGGASFFPPSVTRLFNGKIDDVRFWQVALTASQVAAVYASGPS